MDQNDPESQSEKHKGWYKEKLGENRILRREIRELKREISKLEKEKQQYIDEIPTYVYVFGNEEEYWYYDETGKKIIREMPEIRKLNDLFHDTGKLYIPKRK
jgi:hypothetical protein